MSLSIIRQKRGMALLITVGVATVLIAATLEFHRTVRASVLSAAICRNRWALAEQAASGVHIAMAMLVKDKMETQIDSLQEDWADAEKIRTLLHDTPFEEGSLEVAISDEMGRIQVNALVTPPNGQDFNEKQQLIWERLLNGLVAQNEAFEGIEPTTIVNSLKDWIDSEDNDAITGLTGAESGYYESLDSPYPCRNDFIKDPGDLLRIQGITPDLYFGVGELAGLTSFVTVHGSAEAGTEPAGTITGKININTAPVEVIAALLPEESRDLAADIVEYRGEKDGETYLHELTNPNWYRDVPGLGNLDIDGGLITVASDVFRVVSSAISGTVRLTVTAVVRREQESDTGKWICRILSWKVE